MASRSAAAPRTDECSRAEREDRRVGAGLAQHHVEVVDGREVERVVDPPAELDRLALHRALHRALELCDHGTRHPRADPVDAVEQRPQAERGERVAGIQRDRHAVLDVHRGAAATLLAAVLDVVVDQERRVEQLDRRRDMERVLDGATERLTRRETQRRPEALARAEGECAQRLVQVPARLESRDVASHLRCRGRSVGVEPLVERGRHITMTRTRIVSSGEPRLTTRPW